MDFPPSVKSTDFVKRNVRDASRSPGRLPLPRCDSLARALTSSIGDPRREGERTRRRRARPVPQPRKAVLHPASHGRRHTSAQSPILPSEPVWRNLPLEPECRRQNRDELPGIGGSVVVHLRPMSARIWTDLHDARRPGGDDEIGGSRPHSGAPHRSPRDELAHRTARSRVVGRHRDERAPAHHVRNVAGQSTLVSAPRSS